MDERPIGVFDSGLGGLTVLKEIRARLPDEGVVYFGDCGRAPYGVKSRETIVRYTFQNMRFLLSRNVKLVVIACNTSSAYDGYALAAQAFEVPVIEVIGPGSAEAARVTRNRRVGVIGTSATIGSRAYERAIGAIDPQIKVFARACPLFVPLVEEGAHWWGHEVTRKVAEEYLSGYREDGIDSLVLGCTHYPLLQGVISEAVGRGIELISSAGAVAAEVERTLDACGLRRGSDSQSGDSRGDAELSGAGLGGVGKSAPELSFYTSDSVEKFEPLCSAILGEPAGARVYKLDIEKYKGG
ncbi:MAG: glutamate racemase [Clostridiales bacterium]|jgi:glutamate racemase|nr:glutamate racemase [Clostridiales bacterium]